MKVQHSPVGKEVQNVENINNLFVTSKNETANSPIHEFKVLHKDQRAFKSPFSKVYYFLLMTF